MTALHKLFISLFIISIYDQKLAQTTENSILLLSIYS